VVAEPLAFYYLDTSALVKRYAPEVGTAVLDDLFADPRAVLVIANITIVEMYSALSRKRRNREIADAGFRLAVEGLTVLEPAANQ
jgi:predicted nucleic acid-binding protein